jgi:hypothetical protein
MTETSRPEDLLTRVGLFAALGRVPMQRVRLQSAVLGPVAPREQGTIVILVPTVAGWVASPWLGLELSTIALLGLLATAALGIFDRLALQSIDWSFLVFFGVVLTVGRLSVTVGLDRAAAGTIDRLLGSAQPGPLLFVLAVAGICLLIRLALDQDLTVVLVGVTLVPVAPQIGVDPWVVVITVLAMSVAWFLPSRPSATSSRSRRRRAGCSPTRRPSVSPSRTLRWCCSGWRSRSRTGGCRACSEAVAECTALVLLAAFHNVATLYA